MKITDIFNYIRSNMFVPVTYNAYIIFFITLSYLKCMQLIEVIQTENLYTNTHF